MHTEICQEDPSSPLMPMRGEIKFDDLPFCLQFTDDEDECLVLRKRNYYSEQNVRKEIKVNRNGGDKNQEQENIAGKENEIVKGE